MLIEMLFTSTILIIAIFCLRKLTLGKISMRLRYGLWLLVAVRLLVPLSVGTSAFSVMNLLPETIFEQVQMFFDGGADGQRLPADMGGALTADGAEREFTDGQNAGAETADGHPETEKGIVRNDTAVDTGRTEETPAGMKSGDRFSVWSEGLRGQRISALPQLWWILWLAGFLAVGGYMLFCWRRFAGFLYGNRRELPAETVPEAFAKRLSERNMKVYRVKGLPGPCLVGRHIYIGEGASAQESNLSHILAHEYCHALHRDGFWAFLRCALTAVYWFDPFVWAAAYAVRQDSELACDEAAVGLLGEPERFAYGRTLLSLLELAGGGERCPGTSFMTEGGERSVRERITALTGTGRKKKAVLAAVLFAAVLFCGCAFTGAEREDTDSAKETGNGTAAGAAGDEQIDNDASAAGEGQDVPMVIGEDSAEADRILKQYEKEAELTEEQIKTLEESVLEEADRAAFEETLHYYGDVDDSELLQKREFDVQAYYDWQAGKGSEKPEDGWYLLCRENGGLIYLYGLYTEDFGFRGVKTRIGGDVTNLDMPWCASYQNGNSENIRILESAENGWPRRFVWKLPVEESGTTEIWRLYEGYRYDTGTIDLHILTAEDCVGWAKEHLSFTVDQAASEVDVTYDGDMYLGAIDISAYADREVEEVQIVPDAVGFALDDPGMEKLHQIYSDASYDGTAVRLAAGLKLKGVDGLWFDGLPLLTIQVEEDEDSVTGFRLESPRIDETYAANAPWQELE